MISYYDIFILTYNICQVPFQQQSEILTFYVPIFYTFKYLASHDPLKVTKILKFWCVLQISYLLKYIYSSVLADNLDIIFNLVIHIVLIYDDFNYSQLIYDRMVRPFYKNNEGKINNKTKILEEYFEEKAQQVQFKVTKSAREKVRGFVGEILVGTLNPSTKNKQSKQNQGSIDEHDDDEKED